MCYKLLCPETIEFAALAAAQQIVFEIRFAPLRCFFNPNKN